MNIGVIASGNDQLTIWKFLTRYDHHYTIRYDDLFWSYGDKSPSVVLHRVRLGLDILIAKGVEKMIVPPIIELQLLRDAKYKNYIFPLFQTYVHQYCFQYSLVGKMGVFGDYADIQDAQTVLTQEAQHYALTDQQQSIKKFHIPFAWRVKEVPLWKYYLSSLSYSAPMVNKVIKNDMRYFKDANVDTIIPLNYGYFNYQNTLTKFFNFRKCRFHKLEKLEEAFVQLIDTQLVSDSYSVMVVYTDHGQQLQITKKLLRLIQRGKNVEIQREKNT